MSKKPLMGSLNSEEQHSLLAFLMCLEISEGRIIELCGNQASRIFSSGTSLQQYREDLLTTVFNPQHTNYLASIQDLTSFSAALLVFAHLHIKPKKQSAVTDQAYNILKKHLGIRDLEHTIAGMMRSYSHLQKSRFAPGDEGYRELLCTIFDIGYIATELVVPSTVLTEYLQALVNKVVPVPIGAERVEQSICKFYWNEKRCINIAPQVPSAMLRKTVDSVTSQLNPKRTLVLRARYLDTPNGIGPTFKEIERQYGIGTNSAAQLCRKALKQLRAAPHVEKLRVLIMSSNEMVEAALRNSEQSPPSKKTTRRRLRSV